MNSSFSSSSAKRTAGLAAGAAGVDGAELGPMDGEERDGESPGVRDAGIDRAGELTDRGVGMEGGRGSASELSMRSGEGAALYIAMKHV